jgi:hypothetical protein
MKDSELVLLVITATDLIIDIFKGNKISFESFVKNTHIKISFLESYIKNLNTSDEKERIMQILLTYYELICYNSPACSIQLLEDPVPY